MSGKKIIQAIKNVAPYLSALLIIILLVVIYPDKSGDQEVIPEPPVVDTTSVEAVQDSVINDTIVVDTIK